MAGIGGGPTTRLSLDPSRTDNVMSTPAYTVNEEPLGTARHLRIVGIGAGASGINMIRTLRLKLGKNYEHVVYEKNTDVGGTWLENRYPGCRCDIPSHNYQFSWRPNREWSNFFSAAEEINAYLCRICEDEGMRGSVIKTQHEVLGARWDETQGRWLLTIANLLTGEQFSDCADFLIDASGILNNWKWPDIEGLHDFEGDLVHSARWPAEFDYKDKTVAVIGNGSSGVQIVPAIHADVKKLVHIVRTPTWIIPPRVQIFKMGPAAEVMGTIELDVEENFTPEQISRFQSDPALYRTFVKTIEKETNNSFPILLKDSPMQSFAAGHVRQYMTAMLGGDERLCKALIPDYALGCRRMTPAPHYLQTLTQPNVQVVTDGIRRVLPRGLELDSGEVVDVDAIVCATGFDVSFCPRFPLVGRNGNLQDLWRANTPQAYMSCAVPGLPNYFTFLGPNAPIGHGSVFTLAEHIATYIAGAIRKCQTEGIKAISPSQAAVDDYSEHIRAFMPRTAWSSSCRSWFKGTSDGQRQGEDENGPVTALHPGSRIHFFHMLETFRGEDYGYVYETDDSRDGAAVSSRNRFRYLGNGFSTKELDEEADPTWYLDGVALTATTPDSSAGPQTGDRIKALL
ncbi:flavin-binding protein monooxygenase [Sporothrix brasiliensis 5110]|uniref:Flavin-binding protein monooxygenase n=1 Tax=Sporothrix brasiliensis 5110 TaxID=1398154 RepID=A0A0C2EKW5_9PEZI|nr:flavin-binding protein monooxygenase [Sporothrix brasiliensis 5110]KIH86704.1 flavin-binding protein monooxygenase [Sporothrix brasiliensis 5110]